MDNRDNDNNNNNEDPAAAAALYDANISIAALRQQFWVSEQATVRAQQLAEVRQLRLELREALREAEARTMPRAPRPAHAHLGLSIAEGIAMRNEILALRDANQALRFVDLFPWLGGCDVY